MCFSVQTRNVAFLLQIGSKSPEVSFSRKINVRSHRDRDRRPVRSKSLPFEGRNSACRRRAKTRGTNSDQSGQELVCGNAEHRFQVFIFILYDRIRVHEYRRAVYAQLEIRCTCTRASLMKSMFVENGKYYAIIPTGRPTSFVPRITRQPVQSLSFICNS